MGLDGYGSGIKDRGLNLHGGVDDWFINADNANHVVDFIEGKSIMKSIVNETVEF